ncbi:hypothetical protein NM607_2143 [Neisseria meningitidis NM607]|nr:hypothetical protein NM607_2143 [Neisseria meningitidis NM607]
MVRFAFSKFGHLNQAEHFFDARGDFAFRHFVLFQTEGNVLFYGHMRKKRVTLEHHIDGAIIGCKFGNILTIKDNFSLIGTFHTRQHTQQCRFSAAGTAQKGEDFVLINVQVDVIDSVIVTKLFHQTLDFEIRFG